MPADAHSPATNPPQIRAVILDYGEVLCHIPSMETIERLAHIFQMDPQTFLPIYLDTRAPYDRGGDLRGGGDRVGHHAGQRALTQLTGQ